MIKCTQFSFILLLFVSQSQAAGGFYPFKPYRSKSWSRSTKGFIAGMSALALVAAVGYKYYAAKRHREHVAHEKHDRLMKAIMANDRQGAKQAIKDGAALNQRNERGDTPLTLAAKKGRVRITKMLLQAKADPNITNSWDVPPLIIALSKMDLHKNYQRVAEHLIANDADPNQKANGRASALVSAIRKGNEPIAHQLIQKGAHLSDIVHDEHYVPFLPDDEDFIQPPRTSPVMQAVRNKQYGVLGELLRQRADTEFMDEMGYTPLMRAVLYNDIIATNLLIKAGADQSKANLVGYSPLARAARYGQHEIAKLLIDHGAPEAVKKNPIPYPSTLKSPTELMVEYGHVGMLSQFLPS